MHAPADRFAIARREAAADRRQPGWFCARRLAGGGVYLRWRGLFEFLVSPEGRRILYRRLEHATAGSFDVYLIGQVLSCSLVALGVEPLHGTASVIDGEAVVFLGDCGAGKSTLGAALLSRGFPVLTDDVVALKRRLGRWLVQPGVPRIKLFPSVASKLLGSRAEGVPMHHQTPKLVLPLGTGQALGRPVPLRAIYVLSRPVGDARSCRARVEPLLGREAFLGVIRGLFNLIALDRERSANQFALAARLVNDVAVRRLIYPRRLSALSDVCDTLLADFEGRPSLPVRERPLGSEAADRRDRRGCP
ncbi:MAG: hypothetical protein A3H97_21935 [Acidobacteria bacterium RIFCSPLOWO2_02_FULL_65_29]|nr:MAG: hypothetical protein A3H97_21935 [Acidobacteria bacterium RIFCSPLOWO2_02_FULL_65_29]